MLPQNAPRQSLDELLGSFAPELQARIDSNPHYRGLLERIDPLSPLDQPAVIFWLNFMEENGVLVTERVVVLLEVQEVTFDDVKAGHVDIAMMSREELEQGGETPIITPERAQLGLPSYITKPVVHRRLSILDDTRVQALLAARGLTIDRSITTMQGDFFSNMIHVGTNTPKGTIIGFCPNPGGRRGKNADWLIVYYNASKEGNDALITEDTTIDEEWSAFCSQ